MPSGPNALEISDIQDDEIVATPRRRSEWNNITLRRKPPNGIIAYLCFARIKSAFEMNNIQRTDVAL
jgi:hypothetical protein